jgi:di/tricarboxylate transporter
LVAAAALGGLAGVASAAQLVSPQPAIVTITVAAIVLWAVPVLDSTFVTILILASLVIAGVQPRFALSGFATSQLWILFCVLLYGFAMQSTGLARRTSLCVLAIAPATYRGVLTGFFAIGILLAAGVPSMTVRTAMIVPIAWALTQVAGLPPQSAGTALIVLTSIEMAVLPGCVFLTGSLFGPTIEALFAARGLELSWWAYSQVTWFPVFTLSALIVCVNPVVLRPEASLEMIRPASRSQLHALGPITRPELITAAVLVVSIASWATEHLHGVPPVTVATGGALILFLAGTVRRKDLAVAVPWQLLLFFAGVFGLLNVLSQFGLTSWMAGMVAERLRPVLMNPLMAVVVAALAMFLARFADPAGFIALTLVFLSLADVFGEVGLPLTTLAAALLVSSTPFWFSYQNIWMLMGTSATAGLGFTPTQRVRLANAYAALTLVTLILSVVFWRATGIFAYFR